MVGERLGGKEVSISFGNHLPHRLSHPRWSDPDMSMQVTLNRGTHTHTLKEDVMNLGGIQKGTGGAGGGRSGVDEVLRKKNSEQNQLAIRVAENKPCPQRLLHMCTELPKSVIFLASVLKYGVK